MAVAILICCGLLGYGTYAFGGIEGLRDAIEDAKQLNGVIETLFGSAQTFAIMVWSSWYLAVFLHLLEAGYVAYHAIKTFKLKLQTILLWFWLTLLVGYPVSKKFLEFMYVHTAAAKSAGSKKSH